jgi:release factor glutamine methyltransferase
LLPAPSSLQQAFVETARRLREAGIETPELDARLLLCHAADLSHEAAIARAGETLRPEAAARLDRAITRRLKREPVARITGSREFYGREFRLGPAALDPRPDTETLIEAALAIVEERAARDRPLTLLDLGTGTGCILLTLLAELPRARGIGTDISQAALALAATNARRLGVAPRAAFIAADWLDGISGTFDLIVANPPYLAASEIESLAPEVSAYDPRLALDGGEDGLDAYRRIAAGAPRALAANGRLIVEIGAGQAEAVKEIFAAAGLVFAKLRHDLSGRARVVVAGPDLGRAKLPRLGKKPLGKAPCSG